MPRDLVIVGDEDGRYRSLAARSPRLRLCAVVGAEDAETAAAEHPDAAFLIDALPHAAGRAVDALAALGRAGVVVPPFVAAEAPGSWAAAPLLVGLEAAAWLRDGDQPLAIELGARELGDEPHAAWWHAVAIASYASGELSVDRFDPVEGRLIGAVGDRALELRVYADRSETIARRGSRSYRVGAGRESFDDEHAAGQRSRRIAPYPERVLAALLAPTAGVLQLDRARRVDAVVAELMPRRAGRRALSALRRGVVSSAGLPPMPPLEAMVLGEPPLEQWPFRAGIKPVVFLTVEPAREAAALAPFAGAHVERRERRVDIGDQDRWNDDRATGEPRVELYISRDPAAARRAAALQSSGDPSAAIVELGALMGYPPCCVAAFQRQTDRSNNSLNRYLAAARTGAATPWHWQLNDLHHKLIPFYPCSYVCDAARRFADATLDALDAAHPGSRQRARAALARTVAYLDHDRQWWGATNAPSPDLGFLAPFA